MKLQKYIDDTKQEKDILLMTHIVLGYPSFETNREVIAQMVENGVDLIELQIPFSEPMADGPIILKANQDSLAKSTKVQDCLEFAAEMSQKYDIPFLFMTYYNIIFKHGEEKFFQDAQKAGIQGVIVPDITPEMGGEYLEYAQKYEIDPILIYAPTSTDARMKTLANAGSGFIYCAARRGVTGKKSELGEDFTSYLERCQKATDLPLAVGFGIQNKDDVQALVGKADMAVIGSRTITLVDEKGAGAVGGFIAGLR